MPIRTSFITESDLRTYSSIGRSATAQKNILRKALGDSAAPGPYIFLSHSHSDAKYVADANNVLSLAGINFYVDWLDPEMPERTSRDTAMALKERIRGCHKFVVLASNNAVNSKWVPWELGFADEAKQLENIAILPLADNSHNWEGNEYFDIYSLIEKGSNGRLIVRTAGMQTGITLENWLAS